ncbi:MAG TPA: hypothetical protein VI524_13905, partial [Anaerolineales bacterium]|nr:hypothetical protein [Anaerolineales bacterium]
PGLGGLVPNWLHEFVGSTLAEHPEALEFNIVPLLTSLVVALGGLSVGWLVYRNVKTPAQDRLQIPLLKNKYYFDEAYDFLFVRPSRWIAETLVSRWMDQGFIDSILHLFGPVTDRIGSFVRRYVDLLIVNQAMGDGSYKVTWWFGRSLRPVQTGRIQQYLMFALVVFMLVGAALYFYFRYFRVLA